MVKCRDYEYNKVSAGSVVGRLTVLNVCGKSSNGSKLWNCLCECGEHVDVISSSLNSGLKQSCGCLYDEVKGKQRVTHGYTKSRTYHSWLAMRQRCYYPNHEYFEYYGGKGISVCPEWKEDFSRFLLDMGERPDNCTLDRKDNLLGYTKENCQWSPPSQQDFNTNRYCNNTSGRSGVSLHKLTGKWQATIGYENEKLYLGLYESFEEAALARAEAEINYFGYNKE